MAGQWLQWAAMCVQRVQVFASGGTKELPVGVTVAFSMDETEGTATTDPGRFLRDALREDWRSTGTTYDCGELFGRREALCTIHADRHGRSAAGYS